MPRRRGQRWAPWSRRVSQTPDTYRQRGIRVYVFCGAEAWSAARCYLDSGSILRARERHTLVLPPDEHPAALRWPVRRREVWLIDAGGADAAALCQALVRDGAREVSHYRIGNQPPHFWDLSISQPPADFDPDVVEENRQAEIQEQAELLLRHARKPDGFRVRLLIAGFAKEGVQSARLAMSRLNDR